MTAMARTAEVAIVLLAVATVAVAAVAREECSAGSEDTCAPPGSQVGRARKMATDSVLMQVNHAEVAKVKPHSAEGDGCCSNCAGRAWCSPGSGKCYDDQAKGYYVSCGGGGLAPPPTPPSAEGDGCCSNCAGRAWCSPGSGNCYDDQAKSYYVSCGGGLAPPPTPPSCCSLCNTSFCSPKSSTCYESKGKSYYSHCEVMVVGELVWSDDFDDVNGDGTIDTSKWQYNNGKVFNNELQAYTGREDNSYVEAGVLKIVAKCEDLSGRDYTSARLVTQGRAEWGPGHRVEVRAKMPVAKGTWPAIWMLPTSNAYGQWPHSGEIDIMESVGCTRGKVYGTVHTGAYNHMKGTQVGKNFATDYAEWHTYAIDWETSQIKFYVDGYHFHTFAPALDSSAKWPFDQSFFLILNIAVGGDWGGFCLHHPPSCMFSDSQVMEVDYVHVYTLVAES